MTRTDALGRVGDPCGLRRRGSRFRFSRRATSLYQGAQVLIYAIALLGLNLLTGFNGQISLGHGAFFAIGGYGAAILVVKLGLPYWLAIPVASLVCFGAGFLFGFPALAVRRPLSRARDLRARGRDAAAPLLQRLQRLHRRLAGPDADKAGRAVRSAFERGPVALSLLPLFGRRRSTGWRRTSSAAASAAR